MRLNFITLTILTILLLCLTSCSTGGAYVEMERYSQQPTRKASPTVVTVDEPDVAEEERLRAEVEELERKKRLRELRRDRARLLNEEKKREELGEAEVAEPADPVVKEQPAPEPAAKKPVMQEPVLPGDQFGLVTSFRKGDPAVIMIDVGADEDLSKDQYIVVKQNGKQVCRAKLVRVSKSKSMAYVSKDDWTEGKEVKLKKNDPIYVEE